MSLLDGHKEIGNGIIHGHGHEKDDQYRRYPRECAQETCPHVIQQVANEGTQFVPERSGPGETIENKGQPEIGDTKPQQDHHQLRKPMHERHAMARQAPLSSALSPLDDLLQVADHKESSSPNHPEQSNCQHGGEERERNVFEQIIRWRLCTFRTKRFRKRSGSTHGCGFQRQPFIGVEIASQYAEKNDVFYS